MVQQIPLIQPEVNWSPPSVLPHFSEYETIAVDLETYDPNLRKRGPGWATSDGFIVGVALATKDWSGYLPMRHEGGGT